MERTGLVIVMLGVIIVITSGLDAAESTTAAAPTKPPSKCPSCPLGCDCTDDCKAVLCAGEGVDAATALPVLSSDTVSLNLVNVTGLKRLDNATFPSLPLLRYLNISQCGVESIGQGTFTNMTSLTKLYLGSNRINLIEDFSFSGPLHLISLDLSDNRIEHLTSGVFSGLTLLKRLALENNSISAIDNGTFSSLVILKKLSLDFNKLTSLQSTMFTGLAILKTLQVSHNAITDIGNDTFVGTPMLQKLRLNNNKLSSLSSSVFTIPNLITSLNLTSNAFSEVPTECFAGLPNLWFLSLSNNPISVIRANAFKGLDALKELDMNHMSELTTLEPDAFAGLSSLWVLIMEDDPLLTSVPSAAFPVSSRAFLRALLLDHNGITTFEKDLFANSSALRFADVQGNQLRCDCDARWMREAGAAGEPWAMPWMYGKLSPTCYTPVNMFGIQIKDVVPLDLTCDLPMVSAASTAYVVVNEGDSVNFSATLFLGFPSSVWITPLGVTLHPGFSDVGDRTQDIRTVNEVVNFVPNTMATVAATMSIDKVTTAMDGVYSLIATNAGGATTRTFSLKVNSTNPSSPLLDPNPVVLIQTAHDVSVENIVPEKTVKKGEQPVIQDVGEVKPSLETEDSQSEMKDTDKVMLAAASREKTTVTSQSHAGPVIGVFLCSTTIVVLVGVVVSRMKRKMKGYQKLPGA